MLFIPRNLVLLFSRREVQFWKLMFVILQYLSEQGRNVVEELQTSISKIEPRAEKIRELDFGE